MTRTFQTFTIALFTGCALVGGSALAQTASTGAMSSSNHMASGAMMTKKDDHMSSGAMVKKSDHMSSGPTTTKNHMKASKKKHAMTSGPMTSGAPAPSH